MRLNVGSGDLPAPSPWINVDSWGGAVPHVLADVRDLPFRSGTVDAVYCGHVLEHLSLDRGVPAALAEIRRVLRPGGELVIVGPDLDRAVVFADESLLQAIRDGGCRWDGDEHLWLSTEAESLHVVVPVFPTARPVDQGSLPTWPIAFQVPWQFAIRAWKE